MRPADQVAHWLFAFDAAGMATARALALVATHPDRRDRAMAEAGTSGASTASELPYLRACVLDAVRLWPTTPALPRQGVRETVRGGRTLPAGTTFLIFTPFFHRDPGTLPDADRFAPQAWLDGSAQREPALVPFSAGPGECPGRQLVLLVAATMLAALLRHADYRLVRPAVLDPNRPLPATLDHLALEFGLRAGRSGPGT